LSSKQPTEKLEKLITKYNKTVSLYKIQDTKIQGTDTPEYLCNRFILETVAETIAAVVAAAAPPCIRRVCTVSNFVLISRFLRLTVYSSGLCYKPAFQQ